MKKIILPVLLMSLFSASCIRADINPLDVFNASHLANSEQEKNSNDVIPTLPFSVECVFVSSLFNDNHKLARISIAVGDGTPNEMAATMVIVAKSAKKTGADSIQIDLKNKKLPSDVEDAFRQIGIAYFSPNPEFSLWSDEGKGKQWEVFVSHREKLITQKQVDISHAYNSLYENFIDKGMDVDKADKKTSAIIAKKFNLKKDWTIPISNYNTSTDLVDVSAMSIDEAGSNDSLNELRAIYEMVGDRKMFSSCD